MTDQETRDNYQHTTKNPPPIPTETELGQGQPTPSNVSGGGGSSPTSSVSSNTTTQTPDPSRPGRGKLLKIVFAIIVVVALGLVAIGYWHLTTQRIKTETSITPTKNTLPIENSAEYKIITIKEDFISGPTISTFGSVSHTRNILLQLEYDKEINNAAVSKNGKRLYYNFSSPILEATGKIVTIDSQKSPNEIDFARSNLWALSSHKKFCFWSPDSNKLACVLSERESEYGAGTGRARVSVLDYTTGNVSDVLTSDQIGPPDKTQVLTKLGGWLANSELLIIQTKPLKTVYGGIEPQSADFYSLNIDTKQLNKEFSYTYSSDFNIVIASTGRQVYFQTCCQLDKDIFVEYNLDTKQDTIIASEDLVIAYPFMSEDNSKLIYRTGGYSYSSDSKVDIHVFDLQTRQEEMFKLDEDSFVMALLDDSSTFVIQKSGEGLFLFNPETGSTNKIGEVGESYVGLGYF